MLNTVPTKPNKVVLSDVIGPRRWILMESHLDLSPTGVVQYSGTITTYSKNAPAPVPSTASYNYSLAAGGNTGVNKSQPGGECRALYSPLIANSDYSTSI